ncbi:MAG: sulfate adenylyltransferase subunit CysN [Bacteroidaceae bacterium]|nr:sulfate adenylyltransferase subunit CysN [Bacteroidaceae bacterium]
MNKDLDIKAYLDADEQKDLLRLLTAGSVDDGKSTLIGRLLFDSKKLYDDQLAALERDSKRVGNAGDHIDYALLLDGLKAEREEGITIDVAYRYFSTNRRKFIIADTPGHEQYTRNMITGGSTANLAIILVDARTGVITQTRRHTYLVSLLGIKHIVLAVNKMDLVDFDQHVFDKIVADYKQLTDSLGIDDVTCFPLSALDGDNVVERSERTPWYDGPALLDFLETVPIHADRNYRDFRFPVQYVLRPNLDFRGFSGKVASGIIRVGDEVMALPSMKRSHVKSIVLPYSPQAGDDSCDPDHPQRGAEGDVAFPPQSVTITLEDEIDISRGEMIVHPDNVPSIGRHFTTMLVWMDEEPMDTGKQFFLKHNTNTTRATIAAIRHRVDVNTLEKKPGQPFVLNEIGQVDMLTAKTLFFDAYNDNRQTGAFILIDPITNNTSAVGMILAPLDESTLATDIVPTLDLQKLGIEPEHYDAIEIIVKELARQGIEVKVKTPSSSF